MSAYLKRLNIDSLEEVGVDTTSSAYLKRVEIVEVVDESGDPSYSAEIGTVTIDPDTVAVNAMDSATFSVVVTGGDATDLTYKWTARGGGGNAIIDSPDDQTSATFIFVRSGSETIQCTVSSESAGNSPQSNISFVVVN